MASIAPARKNEPNRNISYCDLLFATLQSAHGGRTGVSICFDLVGGSFLTLNELGNPPRIFLAI